MGVAQSTEGGQQQTAGAQLMAGLATGAMATSSATNTSLAARDISSVVDPTATSRDHATVTVRDKISKEFRCKDPKEHALYSLLQTNPKNMAATRDTFNTTRDSSQNASRELVPANAMNEPSAAGKAKDNHVDNYGNQSDKLTDIDKKTASKSVIEPERNSAASPVKREASPPSMNYHPKKKYLKYQMEKEQSNASQSAKTSVTPPPAVSQSTPGAEKANKQSTPRETLTVQIAEKRDSLCFPSALPSPPKQSETVKQCMEKIMEQMLTASDDSDDHKGPKMDTQYDLIQHKIKKFLQEEPESSPYVRPPYYSGRGHTNSPHNGNSTASSTSVHSNAPHSAAALSTTHSNTAHSASVLSSVHSNVLHSTAALISPQRGGGSISSGDPIRHRGIPTRGGKDLTIMQQIANDIQQELTKDSAHPDPHGPLRITSHNNIPGKTGYGSRDGREILDRQSNVEQPRYAASPHALGPPREGHYQGHRERSGTMDSTGQPTHPAQRGTVTSSGYWRAPSDGRSSVDSQSSQPDIRRGSFGKGSAPYERIREQLVHERNCSSTDLSRAREARDQQASRDMESYRSRSQSLSFSEKSRVSHHLGHAPHPGAPTNPNPYAFMSGGAALRTPYPTYPGQKRSPADAHDARESTSRESMTSHESRESHAREMMFYPPAKPASMHGGSISAGLPRTPLADQREHLLKEAYLMQPNMASPRDHARDHARDPSRDVPRDRALTMPTSQRDHDATKKRYHESMSDRSRSSRAPPPLVHISERHQLTNMDMRNGPIEGQRSRSRSPIHVTSPPNQYHEQWPRNEEGQPDAPLDLSAPSRTLSPPSAAKAPAPHHPHPSRAEPPSRDIRDVIPKPTVGVTPQHPLPYPYPATAAAAGKNALAEQALKLMTPAQMALYQQDWLKHYHWPGYPLTPEALAAAQMAQMTAAMASGPLLPPATAHLLPPATDTRTSPRPPVHGETADDREREYHMRAQPSSHHGNPHSSGPSPSPRDQPLPRPTPSPREASHHSPPALPVSTPSYKVGSANSHLQVPGQLMHSPHNRHSPPAASRDKDRLVNRSIGLNLLSGFPPEDVLFLRCNICKDTYGNVHSFIKHFSRDHASEGDPGPHHVMIESISKAKEVIHTKHHLPPIDNSGHYPPGMSAPSEHLRRDWSKNERDVSKDQTRRMDYMPPSGHQEVMKCPKCPLEFSTRDWGVFQRHVKSHEIPTRPQHESSDPSLVRHETSETIHGQHDTSSQKFTNPQHDSPALRPGQKLMCQECHVSFHDHVEWQLHMSISHSNRTCMCRICHVGFSHIDLMYKHVYTAHNGLNAVEVEFNCLCCNKAFTNERSLIEHMKSKECGIHRNSIGSMISFSVRSRRRDQGQSMTPPSPPVMTPDTTCSENPPNVSESVPVTTIANTTSSNSTMTLGSGLKNFMDNYVQSQGGRSIRDSINVIDLIQLKVEEEHQRQCRDVTSREGSTSPPEETTSGSKYSQKDSVETRDSNGNASRQSGSQSPGETSRHSEDRLMSPLKRRLLGYDKIDTDSPAFKQVKIDTASIKENQKQGPLLPKVNAQSIISNIVESSVLGNKMDFETIYKKSIEKMFRDEEEKERREEAMANLARNVNQTRTQESYARYQETSLRCHDNPAPRQHENAPENNTRLPAPYPGTNEISATATSRQVIVKQDADSSKNENNESRESYGKDDAKNYPVQSIEGVLHNLVEKEAKKLLTREAKLEPSDSYVDSKDNPGAESVKTEIKSDFMKTENPQENKGDAHKTPMYGNTDLEYKTKLPLKNADSKDSACGTNKQNLQGHSNSQILTQCDPKKDESSPTDRRHRNSQSGSNDHQSADQPSANQNVDNEVTGNGRDMKALERLDSYEEGNLVICLEEENKLEANSSE